jgi:hypothetical protein
MFDKVLQIELTIPTSLGWEFSNLFTEVESPSKDSLKSCGFFFSRIAQALRKRLPFQWSRLMVEHTYALVAVWYKLQPKKERR